MTAAIVGLVYHWQEGYAAELPDLIGAEKLRPQPSELLGAYAKRISSDLKATLALTKVDQTKEARYSATPAAEQEAIANGNSTLADFILKNVLSNAGLIYFFDGETLFIDPATAEKAHGIPLSAVEEKKFRASLLATRKVAVTELDQKILPVPETNELIAIGHPRFVDLCAAVAQSLGKKSEPEPKPTVLSQRTFKLHHAFAEDFEFRGSGDHRYTIPGVLGKLQDIFALDPNRAGLSAIHGNLVSSSTQSPPSKRDTQAQVPETAIVGERRSGVVVNAAPQASSDALGILAAARMEYDRKTIVESATLDPISSADAIAEFRKAGSITFEGISNIYRRLPPSERPKAIQLLSTEEVAQIVEKLPENLQRQIHSPEPLNSTDHEKPEATGSGTQQPKDSSTSSKAHPQARLLSTNAAKADEKEGTAAPRSTEIQEEEAAVTREKLSRILASVLPDATYDSALTDVRRTLFADRIQNAIVAVETPGNLLLIQKVIEELDRPIQLVEVSVAIVDINSDALFDWQSSLIGGGAGKINSQNISIIGGFGNNSGASQTLGQSFDNKSLVSDLTKAPGLSANTLITGASYSILSSIKALETKGDAQILSRPSVLTIQNAEAYFDDDLVFYIKVPGQEDSNLFKVVSGTQIRVVPHIIQEEDSKPGGANSQIRLAVHIVDGKPSEEEVDGVPVVSSSEMNTQAIIGENQSLLVAGRYRHEQGKFEGRVPVVGRIPVLGLPFKNKEVVDRKLQRMFLITPRIIDPHTFHTDPSIRAHDILNDGAMHLFDDNESTDDGATQEAGEGTEHKASKGKMPRLSIKRIETPASQHQWNTTNEALIENGQDNLAIPDEKAGFLPFRLIRKAFMQTNRSE